MEIDPAQTRAPKSVGLQQVVNLGLACGPRLRQGRKLPERRSAIPQIPRREFSDDERMATGAPFVEQLDERGMRRTEMIRPDRGIDQRHLESTGLRRRPASKSGMVPPKAASRRAAPRAEE